MDLSLEHWEQASSVEREKVARGLADQLPSGFEFHAIQLFGLAGRQNQVALYTHHAATFAFIPGAVVPLGYDLDRAWEPNPDELESWRVTAEEWRIPRTIKEQVAEVTFRTRNVQLPPCLIETSAGELGWEPISENDSEVHEILRKYKESNVTVCRGDTTTRVRKNPNGTILAERSLPRTHEEVAAELRATGFRFPTSDEWEYVCGAGATTLFRWGDHVPCDRYPTDVSPEEAEWRRLWVRSGGKLERPAEGFRSEWDYHRQPNAFGIFIASDPYKYELVDETGVTRGGDGGCMICGGTGFFIGWLTLATAYFEEHSCKHNPAEPVAAGYTIGRRVLELR